VARRNPVDRPLLVAVLALHVLAVVRPVDVLYPVDPGHIGRLLLHGQLPYRSFPFEYPPLSALAFVLPGAVPAGAAKAVLALEAVALEALAFWVIAEVGGRAAVRRYAVLSLLLFPFLAGGFDALPMVAIVAGTWLLAKDDARGWWVAAVGAMAKLAPGVTWMWGRRRGATAVVALAVSGAALLAPVALARHRDDDWLTYNLDRGVQVESVAATTTSVARAVDGHRSVYTYAYKSFEIDHAGPESALWAFLGLAGLAVIATHARRVGPWRAAVAAVDVVLVAGKVFSPQYLAWAAPVAAIVGGWVWAAHVAMTGLTVGAYALSSGHGQLLVAAGARNVILVATAAAQVWSIARARAA
jgi:hypothetical protein